MKSEDYKFFVNITANETSSSHIILSSAMVNIEGIDSILSYVFKNNRLISASYWFYPKNKFQMNFTKELFSNDFKLIQDFLEKQYGKPDKVLNDWKCLWTNKKSAIIHLIKEQFGSSSHGIICYDIKTWKEMGENTVLLNP